jgi:hypothetical protein
MSKFFSWHVWAAAAIAVAAVLMTIFDPSPLILIAIFFALCVYIVVEIRKRKLSRPLAVGFQFYSDRGSSFERRDRSH